MPLVNLKRAVETFDRKDAEQWANMGSAIAAVGGGINSGLLAFKGVAPKAFENSKNALYSKFGTLARNRVVEKLMSTSTMRFFGYTGAILSGVTLGIHSGKLISQGDMDAGLWYASASVMVAAGGVAGTYGGAALLAGTATALFTPIGWIALGFVLLGGSFVLQWTGEAAKDDEIEKWLDACTFRKRRPDDAPVYASLKEEMDALGHAMYAPKQIETDWSYQFTFNNYLAEAVVFLPGYNSRQSHLQVSANGWAITPFEQERQAGGTVVSLRHYVRKTERLDRVVFDIRYRPSEEFDRDYTLSVTVDNENHYHDPTISGP